MADTRPTRVKKVRFWRWRHNPLRRPSDTAEAWIVLGTWTVALAGGVFAGQAADAAMRDSLAARRATMSTVSAVLTQDADKTPPVSTGDGGDGVVWAKVRWTAADGSSHTGLTRVEPRSKAGSTVGVWIDHRGELVSSPPSATEARLQSELAGALVAAGTGGAVVGCGWAVRLRLDRRRLRDWETEWAQVDPQWRKKMNG
jgi:hypothetical protein